MQCIEWNNHCSGVDPGFFEGGGDERDFTVFAQRSRRRNFGLENWGSGKAGPGAPAPRSASTTII